MFELSLLCPEDRVEVVSDALDALDALSVSVEDADAQTEAEQALFGEPGMPPPKDGWQRSRMLALFPDEATARAAATLLAAQDFFGDCHILGVAEVPDQDWVRLTQSQFTPVEITPEFWIVPTWHEPPAQARQTIRLDPGLAFGTGTHPTTRMCLRWIARRATTQPLGRVLDYGCGSGILAIGAAKFGATDIDAVDMTRLQWSPQSGMRMPTRCNYTQVCQTRPWGLTTPYWPTSWPALCRCWRRSCVPTWRQGARWCWRAFWSGRPMS